MGLCFCLASCFAYGVQQCSLLVVEGNWVLVLRWRSLGKFVLFDIMWGWEVSDGPMSWTWLSHLRGTDLTPARAERPCQPLGVDLGGESSSHQLQILDSGCKSSFHQVDPGTCRQPKIQGSRSPVQILPYSSSWQMHLLSHCRAPAPECSHCPPSRLVAAPLPQPPQLLPLLLAPGACLPFLSFACLIALARASSMMLKRTGKRRHPCLFSHLSEKAQISHH